LEEPAAEAAGEAHPESEAGDRSGNAVQSNPEIKEEKKTNIRSKPLNVVYKRCLNLSTRKRS